MPAFTRSSGFCGSILSVWPISSDPLLIDLSAGPSIGLRIGPSIGLNVTPPIGLSVGPSIGLKVGPSIGVSVGPSIGLRVDPPVGPSLDFRDQPRRNPAFLLVVSDRFVT